MSVPRPYTDHEFDAAREEWQGVLLGDPLCIEPAGFRRRTRGLRISSSPDGMARSSRRVTNTPAPDGFAAVRGHLPSKESHA